MEKLVVATYASGYKRLYSNDEAELSACLGENARARSGGLTLTDRSNPSLYWWPSNWDFQAEAKRAGHAVAVSSFSGIIAAIRRYKGITEAHWYGHGAGEGEFQFGGGDRFTLDNARTLENADVSKHFAKGARIIFFACNAAKNNDFLTAIAAALKVPVRGFTGGVKWELRYNGEKPNRSIYYRGIKQPLPKEVDLAP